MGYMRVRFKKHRWYPHVLKNRDPLIFSVGWRQFQSIPIFIAEDEGIRKRQIKYTPRFGFCYALFYGPLYPIGTSFLCIRNLDEKAKNFRIAANGVVMEVDHSFTVQKKLKLIGQPFKIFKNTSFVKDMFNSDLEVAQYEGAKLQSVSGIRGQVKKALTNEGPSGSFRATFEDKIQMSDLVFLRTWISVDLPKFYNPVLGYGQIKLLKTHKEVREDRNIDLVQNKDSIYIDREEGNELAVERSERVHLPLIVNKNLQEALPFKSKQKVIKSANQEIVKRRTNILDSLKLPTKRPFKAKFLNDTDKKVYSLVQRLNTIGKEKNRESKKKIAEKTEIARKREAKEQEKRDDSLRDKKQRRYAMK